MAAVRKHMVSKSLLYISSSEMRFSFVHAPQQADLTWCIKHHNHNNDIDYELTRSIDLRRTYSNPCRLD